MAQRCDVLVCLAGVLALAWGDSTVKGPSEEVQDVVKETKMNCLSRSSSECVFFEFLTLLDQILPFRGYQVLSRVNTHLPELRINVSNSEGYQTTGVVAKMANHLLADRLFRRLGAWSPGARAFGNSTLQTIPRVMGLLSTDNKAVQRGRRFGWWKYLGSLLLTLALTIFSALISKALTLATISLLLSLLALLGGLGGTGGGGHGHSPPPFPSYRSPVRHPSVQYDEQDDHTNPYVYINRKNWISARSTNYDRLYKKYHFEE